MKKLTLWLTGLYLLLVPPAGPGQDKKPDKKDAPRVTVAIPLGAAPGATTKLTLRGLKIDAATAVRFQDPKVTVKILSRGKANVPDKNPEKVGDTQLEVEVTLPAGLPSGTLSFVLVTPVGETQAHNLLVESTIPVPPEKEPNNGFAQAQPIQIPQAIDGLIREPRDVDVFRLEGKAGQRLVFEVLAARYGSALDSTLTLYDAAGQQVASNDDANGSTDSRLEVTLAKAGTYYLSVLDAHDQGGPAHVYRLVARPAK